MTVKGTGLSLSKIKENISINRAAFKDGGGKASMLAAAEKAEKAGNPKLAQQWRDAAEQHPSIHAAIANNWQPIQQQQGVDEKGQRITSEGGEENALAALAARGGNVVG